MEDTPVDPFSDTPAPEIDAVRDGEDLDWAAIETFLRTELSPEITTSGDFRGSQFPNGSANLTYLIAFGDSLRLGYDHARRSLGRSRHAAQLLARPRR